MFRNAMCLMMLAVLGLTQVGLSGDIPDLAAWWELDDGAGTTVVDGSGNGHDGQTFGDPAWVAGMYGTALEFDGVDDRVEMPTTSPAQGFPATDGEVTWALWFKTGSGTGSRTLIAQGPAGAAHVQGNRSITVEGSGVIMMRAHSVGALTSIMSTATVDDSEWHHVAVTLAFETSGDNDTLKFYVDGDLSKGLEVDTINVNLHAGPAADFIVTLGARGGFYDGLIDDVAIFDRALTDAEVVTVMAGRSNELASGASPADGATDVLRDTTLNWNAGEFAATHDVYFGTTFEDVNDGIAGTLVSQGQSDTSYDAGVLAFGQTYYWRVDEVNSAPDRTVFKGDVWSFTAEPYSIEIPGSTIAVTASSASNEFSSPEKTIDGSGLDANGAHAITPETMWFTAAVDLDPWIQYEFEDVKKLDVMTVWNSNGSAESAIGWGVKDVQIEYSVDGENWEALADAHQISRAPGSPTYNQVDEIAFDGAAAKYVRLNIQSNWGGILMSYGLSEVQFSMIPVRARTPEPAPGSVDILPNSVVTWRAGREAVQHTVIVGSDPNAMSLSASSSTSSLDLGLLDLQLGQTYYWLVDEVNEAETLTVWRGPLWSFSTVPYVTVDDFESYGNASPDRPFQTWLDGFGYSADEFFATGYAGNGTGAGIGHDIWSLSSPQYDGDIMEGTIAKAGKSMPLYFNNTNGQSVSETEITFDSAQDWTVNGIKSLGLNIYGDPDNTGQLYLKINSTRINYDGLSDALQRTAWIPWNIDLSGMAGSLQNVTSLAIGVEGAGATGVIYLDEIRLYPLTPETITPVIPNDSDPNLVTYYAFEGNANDSRGNYPGTTVGDPVYTNGVVGQALVLDNVDDHIVNTFDAEVAWPAYSVSLWVKTDLFNQDLYSSLFNNNSSGADFQIEVNGNDIYGYRGSGNGLLGPVTPDWVHLAVTCDGTQTYLYYNGLYVRTINEAQTQFGQIAIGVNRGMTNLFGGTLDEVRVYNRALSNAEAAGLAGITDEIPVSF